MQFLENNNYIWKKRDLKNMYEELKLAFSNNKTAVDIENILEKYIQNTHNQH